LRLKDEKEGKITRFADKYPHLRRFTCRRLSHFCQCRLSELDPEPKSDRLLAAVTAHARAAGWNTDILPVDYIFQVGGDRMLRLWRRID
jgi:hypothetical protein